MQKEGNFSPSHWLSLFSLSFSLSQRTTKFLTVLLLSPLGGTLRIPPGPQGSPNPKMSLTKKCPFLIEAKVTVIAKC